MMTAIKPITSLTIVALFVLALICDTSVAADRDMKRADKDIRTCISEVSKNANYADASRVVHWIIELDQRNLTEFEIRIETSVYHDENAEMPDEYRASCVTGELGKLVSFRIDRRERSG